MNVYIIKAPTPISIIAKSTISITQLYVKLALYQHITQHSSHILHYYCISYVLIKLNNYGSRTC